jgi:hypothetical protein
MEEGSFAMQQNVTLGSNIPGRGLAGTAVNPNEPYWKLIDTKEEFKV